LKKTGPILTLFVNEENEAVADEFPEANKNFTVQPKIPERFATRKIRQNLPANGKMRRIFIAEFEKSELFVSL
jgi:16S rRNA C967 or C1407 C5-methylase (RsmB/RsmF family)